MTIVNVPKRCVCCISDVIDTQYLFIACLVCCNLVSDDNMASGTMYYINKVQCRYIRSIIRLYAQKPPKCSLPCAVIIKLDKNYVYRLEYTEVYLYVNS